MPNIIAFSTFSTPDESALRREVSSIGLLSFYAIDLSRHGKTGQTCLIHNLIDLTRTRPDPPVLPRLPTSSRLRLKYNFYKIFTYSSLLNMLYISLQFVILYLPPSFFLPILNRSKIIPRLAYRKLEQELHQIWVLSLVVISNNIISENLITIKELINN